MTPLAKENIKQLERLGFNVRDKDYDHIVAILIEKYIQLADACEWSEQDRFSKELERIKKPTS